MSHSKNKNEGGWVDPLHHVEEREREKKQEREKKSL